MRAAIFDMDGTLLDSMGMWQRLIPDFLALRNIVPTEQQIRETHDMGLGDLADYLSSRFDLGLDADGLFAYWRETALEAYLNRIFPKPHLAECLEALRAQGIRMAVATLTEHGLVEPALERHGLARYFDHILTTQDVGGVPKSRPDLYFEAARRLGAPAEECVVFEDALYAVRTATAAGFPTWAIADPYAQRPDEIRRISTRYLPGWKTLLDELTAQPVGL